MIKLESQSQCSLNQHKKQYYHYVNHCCLSFGLNRTGHVDEQSANLKAEVLDCIDCRLALVQDLSRRLKVPSFTIRLLYAQDALH